MTMTQLMHALELLDPHEPDLLGEDTMMTPSQLLRSFSLLLSNEMMQLEYEGI